MNKLDIKMEVQTLLKALIKAKSLKAGIGIILAFLFDFFLPISGMMIGGFVIVSGVGVLGGISNVKAGRSFTADGWQVVVKMLVYMIIIVLGQIMEKVWLDEYDIYVNIPIVYFLSIYIVVHEMENGIDSLNEITGWKLNGVIGIIKLVLKIKSNEERDKGR